jgi:hypothetical protein
MLEGRPINTNAALLYSISRESVIAGYRLLYAAFYLPLLITALHNVNPTFYMPCHGLHVLHSVFYSSHYAQVAHPISKRIPGQGLHSTVYVLSTTPRDLYSTFNLFRSACLSLHYMSYVTHSTFNGARSAWYSLHSTSYIPQFTSYSLHSTFCSLHSTSCSLHSTSCSLHSTFDILHSTFYIRHPTFYIPHSTFCILHSTSYILHSTFGILHSTFDILHSTFRTPHSTFCILTSTPFF